MTPLENSVSLLALGALGPAAQIDVNGSVATMTVPEVDLGPSGHVIIAGDLNGGSSQGSMQVVDLTIDGGRFVIGRDSVVARRGWVICSTVCIRLRAIRWWARRRSTGWLTRWRCAGQARALPVT